jgi:hypothetical protein
MNFSRKFLQEERLVLRNSNFDARVHHYASELMAKEIAKSFKTTH